MPSDKLASAHEASSSRRRKDGWLRVCVAAHKGGKKNRRKPNVRHGGTSFEWRLEGGNQAGSWGDEGELLRGALQRSGCFVTHGTYSRWWGGGCWVAADQELRQDWLMYGPVESLAHAQLVNLQRKGCPSISRKWNGIESDSLTYIESCREHSRPGIVRGWWRRGRWRRSRRIRRSSCRDL